MIDQVSCYKLTCDACGKVRLAEWPEKTDTYDLAKSDVRTFVRTLGWWCAENAVHIGHVQHAWMVRCPTCTGLDLNPPATAP